MCMQCIEIKNKKTYEVVQVPCGKCLECRKKRASSWSFRLMQEERVSSSALFITLTFDTSHVPITRNGFMSLDKRECQLFLKRLRKLHDEYVRIKYFLVGEYGGRTMRPHYHLILFNANVELVQKAWAKGEVHYGYVSEASVGYCLKYICKNGKIPLHQNDDRIPEFSLMSKGLGLSYMSDEMIRWHKANLSERMYCNLSDGKKVTMPRYFKNKMYSEEERAVAGGAAKVRMIEKHKRELELGGKLYWRNRLEAIEAMNRKKQLLLTEKLLL